MTPTRTIRLDVDASLEGVRLRAIAHANRRVDEMQRKLWIDGKADRRAMGKPDPTFAETMRRVSENIRQALERIARGNRNDYTKAR